MSASTMPPIGRLTGQLKGYAWGSHTALAELQGRPAPASGPEAELWFGDHPDAPSLLERPGDVRPVPLDRVVAADPVGELGPGLAAEGGRLPFLLKVLAIDASLSLQTHPDVERARAGFAAEEAAGIPRDAPERCYRDDSPKPELFHALRPSQALCGFRPVAATIALLDRLDVLPDVRDRLHRDGESALATVVRELLSTPEDRRAALVTELRQAAERVVQEPAGAGGGDAVGSSGAGGVRSLAADAVAQAILGLATVYPQDPGVAVALLLDLLELPPGASVYLSPGTLHAYLRGYGVEIMAASDNVLRGGLTPKHVDVDELLRILDTRVGSPPAVTGVPGVVGEVVLPAAEDRFRLSRIDVPAVLDARPSTGLELDRRGPQILLCTQGVLSASADDVEVEVSPGSAAYVSDRAERVVLRAGGTSPVTVFRATPGPP